MKDLEKIKSEDLAAQVQDANPGNFAIEQEVAQLVGATVPAPTEPSADDARELGAQLLVFLRRALTPIQSALRTAVAAIYAHLDSRCTAYTPAAYASYIPRPYDPMRPLTPRTLPNLLPALTAFADRKISDLGDCPDGISLVHLICGSDYTVTELKDDNPPYDYKLDSLATLQSIFPNVTKLTANWKHIIISADYHATRFKNLSECHLPYCDAIAKNTPYNYDGAVGFEDCTFEELEIPSLIAFGTAYNRGATSAFFNGCPNLKKIKFQNAKYCGVFLTSTTNYAPRAFNTTVLLNECPNVEEIDFSSCTHLGSSSISSGKLHTLKLGVLESVNSGITFDSALTYLQIEGAVASFSLSGWNPTDKGTTFLQNFKEHIALRLTANGSGKTLTLSQAVRDAIHAAEATYGIEAIIVTQKGWTLSPAPGASSQ